MEKFAILSLTAEQAAAPASVFGRPLVDHLVSGLERTGVRRFLLTGDTPATDAARIVDRIKARGFGASYHRSLAELDALLPAEARLILVAGDAWILPETLDRLQQYDKAVLVTDGRGWERLDRDHFWAGAAVFPRRSVSAGADLPESWDVASTLLRQLTQDGARRIDIGEENELRAPVRIDSSEIARRVEGSALGAGASGHWLDRLLTQTFRRWMPCWRIVKQPSAIALRPCPICLSPSARPRWRRSPRYFGSILGVYGRSRTRFSIAGRARIVSHRSGLARWPQFARLGVAARHSR